MTVSSPFRAKHPTDEPILFEGLPLEGELNRSYNLQP